MQDYRCFLCREWSVSYLLACATRCFLSFDVSRLCRIVRRISRCIPCEVKIVKRNFAARTSSNKGLQRVNYTGASRELRFVDIRGRFNPPLSASIETVRGLLLRPHLFLRCTLPSESVACPLRDQSIVIGEILYIFVSRCLLFPGFLTGVWSRLVFLLQLRVHRHCCSTVC